MEGRIMRFSDKDLIWISVTPMFPRRVWTAEAKSSGIQQAGALAGDKMVLGSLERSLARSQGSP